MSRSTVAPTFIEPGLQAAFERDGYLVVDLLVPAEVAELRDLFDRLDHPVQEGFFATNETDEVAYKREMTVGVRRVVGDPVRRLLPGHRLIGGYFVVKWPGPESEKGPHLDWSLVDETQFRSVSVWIPLVDTDAGNGALCCVQGSHHTVGTTHRGSPDFPTREEVECATGRMDSSRSIRIDARAGQAIVYSHQTIHFSAANLSEEARPAVNIAAIPDVAELLHFRMRDDGAVERLTVEDGFFEAWAWSIDPPAPLRVTEVDRVNTLEPLPLPRRRRRPRLMGRRR